MAEPDDREGAQAARTARIEELEERLAKRHPVGIRAPVAALCIFAALMLAWLDRHDLLYFFSPKDPLTLGMEGDYRLREVVPNRYVQLHGVPTLRAHYENKSGMVLVGLRDTPFIVKRRALPGEELGPNGKPPPPNQSPFGVRGRLLSRELAGPYEQAFVDFGEWGEVQPSDGQLYLVIEGDRPGRDVGLLGVMGLIAAFIALNAFFLARDLSVRRARAAAAAR